MSNLYKLKLVAQDYLGEEVDAAGVFGLQASHMPLVGGSSQPDMPVIPASNPTLQEMLEAEKGRVSWSAEQRASDLAARIMLAVTKQSIYVIVLQADADVPHKQLMVMPRQQSQIELVDLNGSTLVNLSSERQSIGLTCSLTPLSKYAGGNRAVLQTIAG